MKGNIIMVVAVAPRRAFCASKGLWELWKLLKCSVTGVCASGCWQEALEKSRPDFISRSQRRVREMERRAQQRRRRQLGSDGPRSGAEVKTGTLLFLLLCGPSCHPLCPSAAAEAPRHTENLFLYDISRPIYI